MKRDAIAAIFYVSNWWYISQNVDYFNQFAIEPLKHLWSLAIEEQFYLFSHWLSRSYYIDLNREILFKRYLLYR